MIASIDGFKEWTSNVRIQNHVQQQQQQLNKKSVLILVKFGILFKQDLFRRRPTDRYSANSIEWPITEYVSKFNWNSVDIVQNKLCVLVYTELI